MAALELSESDIATHNVPEQGQVVQVRSRQWVVTEVKPGTLPTPAMQLPESTAQTLLTLASIDDDGLGEELQVVWEIEPGARIIEKVALPEPAGLYAPDRLDPFLDVAPWSETNPVRTRFETIGKRGTSRANRKVPKHMERRGKRKENVKNTASSIDSRDSQGLAELSTD